MTLVDPSVLQRYRTTVQESDRPDIVGRLIEVWCQETPRTLDNLVQAVRDLDPQRLYMAAHSLKSSAANMGATAMAELSGRIETSGRNGDLSEAWYLVSQLRALFPPTALELRNANLP